MQGTHNEITYTQCEEQEHIFILYTHIYIYVMRGECMSVRVLYDLIIGEIPGRVQVGATRDWKKWGHENADQSRP